MNEGPENTPRGRRRWIRLFSRFILYGTSLVIVIVLVAFLLLQTDFARKKIRDLIQREGSKALQADLKIGSLSGDLLFEAVIETPVLSQGGQPLFSADRIRLEYALPLLLRKILFIGEIRIEGPRLNLVRESDGPWNFQALVPEKKEAPAEKEEADVLRVALGTVSITDGEINVRNGESSEVYRIRDLQLEVRPGLAETISVAIDQISFVSERPELTLSSLRGTVSFTPSSRTLSVDRLHLRTTDSELTIQGKAVFPDDGPQADLTVEMARLSLSEIGRIVSLSPSMEGTLRGAVRVRGKPADLYHELDLAMGESSLKTSGHLNLLASEGLSADVQGRIQGLNPAALPVLALSAYPGEINADFKMEGSRLLEAGRKVSATLTLQSSRLAEYTIQNGLIDAVLDGNTLHLREARVESPLGEAVLHGRWNPGTGEKELGRMDLGARIFVSRLEKILPEADIQGSIHLEVTSEAALPRPLDLHTLSGKIDATIGKSSVSGLQIRQGNLRAAFSKGKLELSSLTLDSPAGRLHAAGTIFPLERRLSLTFDGTIPELGVLADQAAHWLPHSMKQAELSGKMRISGEIGETWDRPVISATVTGEKTTFSTLHASRIELSGRFQGSVNDYAGKARLHLNSFQAGQDRFPEIELEADIRPKTVRLKARLSHESGGEAAFSGALDGWTATEKEITLDVLRISSAGVDLKNIDPIRASLKGQALHVSAFHLSSQAGDITATASVIPGQTLTADLALSLSRLDFLSRFWKTGPEISGSAQARIALSGAPAAPRVQADLTLNDAKIDDFALTELKTTLRYDGTQVDLDASVHGMDRKVLTVTGTAGMALSLLPFSFGPGAGGIDLTLSASGIGLSEIPIPEDWVKAKKGTVDLHARLSGSLSSPKVSANLSVRDGLLSPAGRDERFSFSLLDVRMDYRQDAASFSAVMEEKEKTMFRLEGKAPLSLSLLPFTFQPGRQGLQATLESEGLELADLLLTAMPEKPGFRMGGVISARVQAAGNPYSPKITGKLSLAKGFFSLKDPPLDYEGVNGEISFSPDEMTIHRFSIRGKEEGTLSCSGQIGLNGFRPASFGLRILGQDFYIPFHRAIYARIGADLTLSGPGGAPRLTGEITVQRGQVDIDRFSEQGPAEIRIVGERPGNGKTLRFPEEDTGMPGFMKPLSADVQVSIPKNVWLKGKDLNAEVAGGIELKKDPGRAFILIGSVNTIRGTYIFQRKLFKIDRGAVTFIGLEEINPNLDVRTVARISGVNIIIRIGGTAKKPTLSLDSEPAMPENDIISYLMFGRPASQLRGAQSFNAEKAALGFTGQMAADQLKGLLSDIFQLDTLIISPGSEDIAGGATITVGKYVAPDVFVTYQHGFKADDPKQLEVTYEITPNFSIEAEVGNERSSGVDFVWELDF